MLVVSASKSLEQEDGWLQVLDQPQLQSGVLSQN